jgi:hypothetical protein
MTPPQPAAAFAALLRQAAAGTDRRMTGVTYGRRTEGHD